jgi:Zn-dependent protease
MINVTNIVQILGVVIIPLLFAITLHEAAHGWMASKLGDKTALMLGRVSFNPVRHLDMFGTIILPLVMIVLRFPVIFGWAKPVPITIENFKHPRRDMAFVALAGLCANLVMAFVWALLLKANLWSMRSDLWSSYALSGDIKSYLYQVCTYGMMINCVLFVLNSLPIPPLDGSRVVSALLPRRIAASYERIEPYGLYILLGLIIFRILNFILIPLVFGLLLLIQTIVAL